MAMKKELEPLYRNIDEAVCKNYLPGQTFTQKDLLEYAPKPFGSYGDITYALRRMLRLNKIRLVYSVKIGHKKYNTYVVLAKNHHRFDKIFSVEKKYTKHRISDYSNEDLLTEIHRRLS